MHMSYFDQKIKNNLKNFCDRKKHHWASNLHHLYHRTAGDNIVLPVCCLLDYFSEILLYIKATDYRSNFAKTILFENCSCFSKIPFSISVESPKHFSVSFRFPQVTEFGKSTVIYLANSFCQLYSALWSAWPIRTIRKSAARWRGRRARGYRKLILRANLLYVPNIKMQRRLRSRSVHNFCTCAWRMHARWQNPEKKVFRRRINRILPLHFISPSASTEVVHRPRSQSPLHFDIRNI